MDIIGHNGQYWTMDIMDKIGQNQQKKWTKLKSLTNGHNWTQRTKLDLFHKIGHISQNWTILKIKTEWELKSVNKLSIMDKITWLSPI